MSDSVLLAREGAIATITFNKPERMNALDRGMWERLGVLMREMAADDDLRCIVLRGAGTRAFAAGADIAEFATERADAKQAAGYGEAIHHTMQAVRECPHPTIAMIHGACVGGGLEVAAMCDMRICGASSRFGIPIKKLGLTMAYGELMGLLSVVGPATALEILLEGRVFKADEALAKGLVNRVVPDELVESEALEAARRIAEGAPLVARWHKKFIRKLQYQAQISAPEWAEGFACFDTADYREGVAAFLAKRDPQFRAR
ncbi:MAG TPA: enoyl-CoA hydratase-related protein [Burkholderiales bacterium]|jgi:enoyl-CoA hydratase/carnithine racemase